MDPLEEFLAQAEEEQQRFKDAQSALERMEVTGRSRNNVVTAKLRGTGQLTDITIDPRQMGRYDAKALGGLVVDAVNDAGVRLAEASREMFAPFIAAAEAAP
jgi:DNA-binding YbaB/EbfC family protein